MSSVTTLPAIASVLNASVSSTSAYVFRGEQIGGKKDRRRQRKEIACSVYRTDLPRHAGDHHRRAANRRKCQPGPERARRASTKHQPRAEPDEERGVVAEERGLRRGRHQDGCVVERQVEAEERAAQYRELRGPHASLVTRLRRVWALRE